jgi:hypothetical protein
MKLTVFFDGQYWIGVVEAEKDGRMIIARHVFGPEPSSPDVLSFVSFDLDQLIDRSMPVALEKVNDHHRKRINAKRLRRMVKKESRHSGIGTKAQKAMKEAVEQRKKVTTRQNKEKKENLLKQRYQLRKKKAKRKHRGKA